MSVPSVSERERRFTAVAAEWQRLVLDARRPDETRFAAVKREADAIIDAGQWVSGPADMLSVIGRQRDELVHSRVIGWLLTPTGRHGLGRSFLRALLDHVWPGEASLRAECGQRISFKDHLLPRRRRLPGRPLQPGPQAGTGRWVTSAAVYSVDTSALIDGLERYYFEPAFPGIWQNVASLIEAGRFFISEEVWEEVRKRDEVVKEWCQRDGSGKLIVPTDPSIAREVKAILRDNPRMVMSLKGRNRADPFVVALARIKGATVVTGESDDGNERHPKIPFVCRKLGITCIRFTDLIRAEGWVFM